VVGTKTFPRDEPCCPLTFRGKADLSSMKRSHPRGPELPAESSTIVLFNHRNHRRQDPEGDTRTWSKRDVGDQFLPEPSRCVASGILSPRPSDQHANAAAAPRPGFVMGPRQGRVRIETPRPQLT